MRGIAVLLSVTAAMLAVFGVVPAAASANKRNDDAPVDGTDVTANDVGGYVAQAAEPVKAVGPRPSDKQQHNAKLLNRLGMKRVRTNGGPNHHRKRLASQSRSKYAADGGGGKDSQMFVVKLPPHAHFYDDGSAAVHHRLQPHQHRVQQSHHQHHRRQPLPYKSPNTVPVGFVSNGKPAKVYHWNLPAIKQAARYKQVGGNAQQSAASAAVGSVAHAPRRTFYYKPRAAGKPMKKSFVNNGKPNGFYVVSNKNAAAAVPQYHKIVKAYYGDD